MLVRSSPRALLSFLVAFLFISVSFIYFKSSGYDPSALWDFEGEEPRKFGHTGPDVGDLSHIPKVDPNAKTEQDASNLNSFGEVRTEPFGERVWRPKPEGYNYTRTLVVPKTAKEDVEWVEMVAEELGAKTAIYEVEGKNKESKFKVPKNKGREAMVYLSYIIDHYNELPDIVMFFHAHRQAWHNNILLDLDSTQTIKRLNPERVDRIGYMNMRCHLDPGCPNWIHMDRPDVDYDEVKKPEEKAISKKVWRELFPNTRIPAALSQPCCAQFAVSRDAIRQHPKSKYIYFRDWLLNTDLEDAMSGRIFEYSWQYIFTGNAELCPIMHSCYCDGYGICFGSAQKLDDWLGTLKESEKLHDKKESERGPEDEETANKLDALIRREKEKAYERGKDPKNRELERERID